MSKSNFSNTLVLFDFDGTLCKIDSFTGFMRYTFSQKYFYQHCLKMTPYIAAYFSKLYPAHRLRPRLYRTLFQNQEFSNIQKHAKEYANILLNKHLNLETQKKLKYHQQQNHHIIIVSASLNLYLQPIADHFNVELICSQVDILHHRLTGHYLSNDCSGHEKVLRLKQKFDLSKYETIYAYGNSSEDFAMLNIATHAYWVNTKHQILDYQKMNIE